MCNFLYFCLFLILPTLSPQMKSLKIPNGVIRIRKTKKNRQHSGQKKKDKETNNDL